MQPPPRPTTTVAVGLTPVPGSPRILPVTTAVQMAFGVVLALLGVLLLALPGLAVGGAIGLLVRRFAQPSRRLVWQSVGAWVFICLATTLAVGYLVGAEPTSNALAPLAVLFIAMLGVGSAAGGACGLYAVLSPGLSGHAA